MNKVTIQRTESTNEGTFGELTVKDFKCLTGELPWRDNQKGISCIPPGEYLCKWQFSLHLNRDCYHVLGVPEREGVLIHPANFMGDKTKGFKAEVEGCIALGAIIAPNWSQKMLQLSGKTVETFEKIMNREDFTLTIMELKNE